MAKLNSVFHWRYGHLLMLLLLPCAGSADSSRAEMDWENYWPSDETDAIFDSINDGELTFLDGPPENKVHHHHNTLIIQQDSLETGWVGLQQCHEHLDVFRQVQIVYRESRIRKLRIREFSNIGSAQVEGHTVQLTDVKPGASICLEAESKVLTKQKDGSYVLQNGPFMRKFFDGYFPMRVTLDVKLPPELTFTGIDPPQQKGFEVVENNHHLHLDAWFEGRLVTRIQLKNVN